MSGKWMPFDERLAAVRGEIERFEKAASRYTNCRDGRGENNRNEGRDHHHDGFSGSPCPNRAAVKRASLDVTRALAAMRKI